MSLCNELTVCLSVSSFPCRGSEQVISTENVAKARNTSSMKRFLLSFTFFIYFLLRKQRRTQNWSPWQELETSPRLPSVDVTILKSSLVETRPLIPRRASLFPPSLSPSAADSLASQIELASTETCHLLPGGVCSHTLEGQTTNCSPALPQMLSSSNKLHLGFCLFRGIIKINKKKIQKIKNRVGGGGGGAAEGKRKSLLQRKQSTSGGIVVLRCFKDDTGDVSRTWKGFLGIKKKIYTTKKKKQPCGLNHCSVSVLFQFFFCAHEK